MGEDAAAVAVMVLLLLAHENLLDWHQKRSCACSLARGCRRRAAGEADLSSPLKSRARTQMYPETKQKKKKKKKKKKMRWSSSCSSSSSSSNSSRERERSIHEIRYFPENSVTILSRAPRFFIYNRVPICRPDKRKREKNLNCPSYAPRV